MQRAQGEEWKDQWAAADAQGAGAARSAAARRRAAAQRTLAECVSECGERRGGSGQAEEGGGGARSEVQATTQAGKRGPQHEGALRGLRRASGLRATAESRIAQKTDTCSSQKKNVGRANFKAAALKLREYQRSIELVLSG